MTRKGVSALVLAGAVLATGPAQAVWRVVGPGMAVTEARSGKATLAAECLHDGMVLGIYNVTWDFDHGEELDLVIDGQRFTLHQYGAGDRIVFSDADTPGGHLDISPQLRAALKSAGQARLEGSAVQDIDPKLITFGMNRSGPAIGTVERDCD